MVQVYFIGAGPGAPELLTLKAKRIIGQADVIIYADSLISPEVLQFARTDAEVHKSASLTLEETIAIIINAVERGKTVARLQSGDPSIYGAIHEQMDILDEKEIEYEIIPGVSSVFAAAATLKTELTVPELAQTVIITRKEGRTPVPAVENLKSLARHQTSLVLFLSIALLDEVVAELIDGGYAPDTPAAVVYKATWPDEIIIRSTLNELTERVRESGIKKQALILVGEFLEHKGNRSKLYDKDFRHGYR